MKTAKGRMKNAKWKILTFAICSVHFAILVSGCASFRVAGEIQQGRRALLRGEPEAALPHFQRAAQLDPTYLAYVSPLTEGVWTYTGRAYYDMKQFPEARKALEQALSRTEHDHFARLYLGLILGRDGDRQRGLRQTETALEGFHGLLDDNYHPDARFWDSTGELRSVIRKQLASISGKEVNWPELISTGEWLGQQLEEEIDLSARLKQLEETRDSDNESPAP
ncbi:MAG: tetratricopeptide repeat protein [Deltaproteobacteria bacterium]|nr:tetratricopeptide repeat protein [Deltaproteobacteria bacterium]MDZ4345776.1 tetratricopeptide repeat protein [Candidatus Binatia bacterium]